ncbi:MAG TPA: TRL-like family protein [Leptospiraceae bacterium]|nr:TRL-like family protein [Leptospiraceae bacterium]
MIKYFIIIAVIFSRCAIGPVNGALFTDTNFPGQFNSENNVAPDRSSSGCQHSILGLFSWGDAGAGSTAHRNGITKIAVIDHSAFSVLFSAYRNYCTKVTGE